VRRARALGLAALLTALTPWVRPAKAQIGAAPSGRCQFIFDAVPSAHLNTVKLPSGQYNSYIGGGVVARCPAQRLVLKSDSLEAYGDEGRYFFIGRVDYTEPRLTLKSDFLTYFQREERLLATSNVDAQLPSGSNLKGPQLEFWRAIPRVREQHATAIGRPTISIVERDSAGRPQPPVSVTGNNVWMTGDSTVASQGEVVVVRHGATEWSRSGQHTGVTDLPLLPDGEDDGRRLGPVLEQRNITHAFVSPLTRAGGTPAAP